MKKLLLLLLIGSLINVALAQNSFSELNQGLKNEKELIQLEKKGLITHMYTFTKWPSKMYIEKPVRYKKTGILTVMIKNYAGI